ncbi:hypothetical protein BGX21_011494 [Mortierella sp. AD011]|nr:hypothetical protein BGX20_001881 [Mortierella sp. AD010]KAF9390306.1 hypothetical protein BGX21_011494 [Mortierella sp. AD011]
MTLQVARAVDNLERYNVTRSNVNIYNNVIVGNLLQFQHTSQKEFISSLTGPQEWAKLLLDPINSLLHQHPLLAHVVGDHLTAKPMFLRLECIDLLELIRITPIKTPAEVGRVFEQEHNLPFDLSNQSTPLWRLTIAPIEEGDTQSFYLLYIFHHVIGDGRSAMAVTDQLVQQLNLQAKKVTNDAVFSNSSNATTKIRITSTKPIPESIESRINCYPSFRTLICEATRALLLPGFLKKALEIKYWAGEFDSSLETPNVTELALLQLTMQETLKVIQAAKRHSTTVQAVLYTASVFAAKSVFMSNRRPVPLDDGTYDDNNNHIEEEAIVFATPVSLRDLIPNPIAPGDQGNYTSEFLDYNVRVRDGSSFWEMTAVYRRRIIEATTTARGLQDLLEHFGMLSLLPKKDGGWESYMVSKVHKDQHGRKATIKLSNIGRGWERPKTTSDGHVADSGGEGGDDGATPRFLIKDGVFSQSSGVTASALTMSVATANGVLTISTTWQKAAFRGRSRGELFMSEFKRILFEAIEDEKVDYMFKDAKS